MRISLDSNAYSTMLSTRENTDRFLARLNQNDDVLYISEPIITESMLGFETDQRGYINNRFTNLTHLLQQGGFARVKLTLPVRETARVELSRGGNLQAPPCHSEEIWNRYLNFYSQIPDIRLEINTHAGDFLRRLIAIYNDFQEADRRAAQNAPNHNISRESILETLNTFNGVIPWPHIKEISVPSLRANKIPISNRQFKTVTRSGNRFAYTRFISTGFFIRYLVACLPHVEDTDPAFYRPTRGAYADVNVAACGALTDVFITADEILISMLGYMRERCGYPSQVVGLGQYQRGNQ